LPDDDKEDSFEFVGETLSIRDRITGLMIQERLEAINKELKEFTILNDHDLKTYIERVKQFLADNMNFLNEVNYDIMDDFKEFPSFKEYFDEGDHPKNKNLLDKETMISIRSALYFRKMIEKSLMKNTLKLILIYSYIADTTIEGLQKVYGFYKRQGWVDKTKKGLPPPSEYIIEGLPKIARSYMMSLAGMRDEKIAEELGWKLVSVDALKRRGEEWFKRKGKNPKEYLKYFIITDSYNEDKMVDTKIGTNFTKNETDELKTESSSQETNEEGEELSEDEEDSREDDVNEPEPEVEVTKTKVK